MPNSRLFRSGFDIYWPKHRQRHARLSQESRFLPQGKEFLLKENRSLCENHQILAKENEILRQKIEKVVKKMKFFSKRTTFFRKPRPAFERKRTSFGREHRSLQRKPSSFGGKWFDMPTSALSVCSCCNTKRLVLDSSCAQNITIKVPMLHSARRNNP